MEDMYVVISALISIVPTLLIRVAAYVLTAMGLYTIAQRREIGKPWLAWIPVVNSWILGSISDQYQYVVKGKNKSKRKVLLVLRILSAVLGITMVVLGISAVAGAILAGDAALDNVLGITIAMLGLCIPMLGIAIASAVVRYMALYDVYRSVDPGNSVLFLVLSIFVGITEPFFLFFSRDKDAGMPPRKRLESACECEETAETVETAETE